MNRKTSWDSIPYKSKCFFAQKISVVDVQVVYFLLHEMFTTAIYHTCFTSANDEKHTIIIINTISY